MTLPSVATNPIAVPEFLSGGGELGQRIRDVRQGPDGYVYVLTEENDAALIRIEPGDAASTR